MGVTVRAPRCCPECGRLLPEAVREVRRDGVWVDVWTGTIGRDGCTVTVETSRENARLVATLLAAGPRGATRHELIRALWPHPDDEPEAPGRKGIGNALSVRVCRLRGRLAPLGLLIGEAPSKAHNEGKRTLTIGPIPFYWRAPTWQSRGG